MQETEIAEMLKKKQEKQERKNRDRQVLIIVMAVVLGAMCGYVLGYQMGLFDGYQFCLKQFEIVKIVPELYL